MARRDPRTSAEQLLALEGKDLGAAAEVLREMTGLTFLNLVRLLWLTCLDRVLLRWVCSCS